MSNSRNSQASYTDDWADISNNYKSLRNYKCEHCGVSLKTEKRLLHTHHINGVRNDNRSKNLRALCADCHKKQPHHGHLHVSRRDTLAINYLRRKQNKFDVFDYDRLGKFADTALEGLISKCRRYSVPIPDLGVATLCGSKPVPIDLAWTQRKVAVLINTEDRHYLESESWKVWSAAQALTNFEIFQQDIR